MTNIYISMLRGINVGGQKKIKMKDLIDLYKSLHLNNIKTYIQSGNLICVSDKAISVNSFILALASLRAAKALKPSSVRRWLLTGNGQARRRPQGQCTHWKPNGRKHSQEVRPMDSTADGQRATASPGPDSITGNSQVFVAMLK